MHTSDVKVICYSIYLLLCATGKTSLADVLVASNGIISARQAGKVISIKPLSTINW